MDFAKQLVEALPSRDVRSWGAAEWSLLAPLVVHWVVALIYELFDTFELFQSHKLLQPEEFKKNKVTKLEVMRGVLLNQLIILAVGWVGMVLEPGLQDMEIGDAFGASQAVLRELAENSWLKQNMLAQRALYLSLLLARLVTALFVYDTWQYWVHLGLHTRWTYRRIHIWHHLVNAPWSYAATYVHPLESFLLDALGPAITCSVVGLTAWERVTVFTLSVIKTLNDHSGYRFAWDPIVLLGKITGSDMVYHTIHHQPWGIKTNYALWFTFWDNLMGTIYKGKGTKRLNVTEGFLETQLKTEVGGREVVHEHTD